MIDIARFSTLSVPRYTSYPTAPHFSAAIGSAQVRDWLGELDKDARISAYFHVPFCQSMCHYCGCHTKVTRQMSQVDTYARHLVQEIAQVSGFSAARCISDIHWGGGTPSMLGTANLRLVWAELNKSFDLTHLVEHAMELDPRMVTPELAAVLAEIGVNRVSLGVQDFNPDVQEAIGRVQPFEQVEKSIKLLREVGITRVNVDLIYGLPLQTARHIADNVAYTLTLNPDRVSVFGYAHVPWLKKHQRLINEAALPQAMERMEQAEMIRDLLCASGYVAVGMDHFAKPEDTMAQAVNSGDVHRNFQGYTTDATEVLIGFGASAISTYPQGYAQNDPGIGTYETRVKSGEMATVRGHAFNVEDRIRGGLIEQLMCRFEVDLDALVPANDAVDLSGSLEQLRALETDGLVKVLGRHVKMTDEGRPFVRVAAQTFDAYTSAAARYSRAI